MKVILLRDVAKVGRKNDVVEVPNGYGMNKLIPEGSAKPATTENVKAVEQQAAKNAAAAEEGAKQFAELVAVLEGKTITIEAEANEEGRLFKAVNAADVVAAIAAQTDLAVTEDQIIMGDPIKQVGDHTVTLASGPESSKQTVVVSAK